MIRHIRVSPTHEVLAFLSHLATTLEMMSAASEIDKGELRIRRRDLDIERGTVDLKVSIAEVHGIDVRNFTGLALKLENLDVVADNRGTVAVAEQITVLRVLAQIIKGRAFMVRRGDVRAGLEVLVAIGKVNAEEIA